MRSGVVVITGVMASGRSTIAQALAERLPRAAHIWGDVFRRIPGGSTQWTGRCGRWRPRASGCGNSTMTVGETVHAILAGAERARVV